MDTNTGAPVKQLPPHPFRIIWWANFVLLAFTVVYINITGTNIFEFVGSRGGVHGSLGGVYLWIPVIYIFAIYSITKILFCMIKNTEVSKNYYIRSFLYYILVFIFSFSVF